MNVTPKQRTARPANLVGILWMKGNEHWSTMSFGNNQHCSHENVKIDNLAYGFELFRNLIDREAVR